jgi:hypothetical protein
MGNRAHVVKEYVCKYADGCWFNWAANEVYEMLTDNDVEIWRHDECIEGDWEINGTDTIEAYIAKLKQLPPDETNQYFTEDPNNAYITNAEVIDALEEWVKHCCRVDDVIRIQWF